MKTTLTRLTAFLKLVLFLVCLLTFLNSYSQTIPGLVFKNPTLKSGTDLQKGAVYLFKSVTTGVDATVTVDDLVNGAELSKIDDNSGGLGYTEAFQPEIKSGKKGDSYVAFTVKLIEVTTNSPMLMKSLQATALDIDGNDKQKEFDEIDMIGGSASYMGGTLEISLKSLPIIGMIFQNYRADNLKGVEKNGIDTSSKGNMFTVAKSNVSSFSMKLGANSTNSSASARQFSIYMKAFQYPNLVMLPLNILSFTAQLNNNATQIKWVTAAEVNLNSFVIEKSVNGMDYSDVATVNPTGSLATTASYSYTDKIAASGTIYYRLRCVDNDGKVKFSSIQVVKINGSENELAVSSFPNPFSNSITIKANYSITEKELTVQLFSANGQLVKTKKIAAGNNTIETSDLNRGIYIVRIATATQTQQYKMVKG